jgi:hypothetical protein
MKTNEIVSSLIKVADKLSTTKDFEVVSHIDSIIKKVVKAVGKTNLQLDEVDGKDLRFANELDAPLIRDAAAVTLIQIADAFDKTNIKLSNRVDAAIKLLATSRCKCECNNCSLANEGSGTHCGRTNRNCK